MTTTSARVVPWARGARWLADGWRLFRVAPLAWIALVFGYWMLMIMVSMLPAVGIALASILVPPFSVGFMSVSRAAARRAPLALPLLFAGFRERVQTQLLLGGVYLACLALLLAASALADGGALAQWLLSAERPAAESLQSGAFFLALASAAALYLPVMFAFWFAPVLAAWHGMGVAKALFFSLFACLMNWRAFLSYGVAAALVTAAAPLAALSALDWMSRGALRAQSDALLFPLLLVILPTLLASFYASYRDIFGAPDAA
ncbi:MAG TPA: BPSS1780 family membrane protein [Burkholderiales bacterium]|nr:BPSS1780 family membrane protein [Burkholderiales bacterium]